LTLRFANRTTVKVRVHTSGTGGMAHAVPLKDYLFGLSKPFRKDFCQGRQLKSFY